MTAYSRRYHSRVGRRRAGRRGVTPADCPTASSPASDNLPSRAGRTCRRCRRTFVAPPRGHKVTHWTDRQTDRHRDIALCHRTFVVPPRGHTATQWTDRQTQGHCFMSQNIRGATTRPQGDSLDRQTDTGTLLYVAEDSWRHHAATHWTDRQTDRQTQGHCFGISLHCLMLP